MAIIARHLTLSFGLAVAFAASTARPAVVASANPGPAPPELPRVFIDTAYSHPAGRTISVAAGGDLQAALNAAKPGDVIALAAGATFTGPFTLPAKSGTGWIVVRSDAPDSSLPAPGTRIDPSYAHALPKLVAASGSVVVAASGAHHYRFIGIEIRPKDNVFLYQLVQLGGPTMTSVESLPSDVILDRCYLHGDPQRGLRRAIVLNSRSTAVIDSYISDCKEVGNDSQALAGWGGPGPFKIVNNYLEGAGENILFGGGDPWIANLVPADIEIRRNQFSKPRSWRIGDPTYTHTPWSIKNLFELKNARRVLIERNVFEYNWPGAQNGFAILFTVRNQDGTAPWSVVEDVTFQSNLVRHVGSGINILARDDLRPSQQGRRIRIAHNLFDDVGGTWGSGRLFQLLAGSADIAIEHNTAQQTENIINGDGEPHVRFAFRDNITPHGPYGIIGTGTGVGRPTIAAYFPGAIIAKNVIIGGNPAQYSASNFFPRSVDEVGFVDRARGDYRLARSSRYRRSGSDGTDPGVDFEASFPLIAAPMLTSQSIEGRR
ncbi:MAG TPA: hypothetical protein VGZ27_05925 [Vicinamibacterales bacterium]|jgi:hypothetical protein|nr:hypothetical protein [Vicinamibacterales bacterium]